ncbi:MAG: HIT family protein [Gemmataceae bacterium]
MDHLWAPWRMAYIANPKPPAVAESCFLCQAVAAEPLQDRANLLVHRGPTCVVMLNKFPYNNGHLLLCPATHKKDLRELTIAEVQELHELKSRLLSILDNAMKPHGYNVGLNLGAAAGAGLPGHLHWHIVPRWNGDSNFMPVLGETRVLVQALDALYDLIAEGLRK